MVEITLEHSSKYVFGL